MGVDYSSIARLSASSGVVSAERQREGGWLEGENEPSTRDMAWHGMAWRNTQGRDMAVWHGWLAPALPQQVANRTWRAAGPHLHAPHEPRAGAP